MPADNKPAWYVVHTYSEYENKVMDSLQKTVNNLGLQDMILDIRVPTEDIVEIKNGKRHIVTRKLYPGYVMVHMIKTPKTWYVVRNTRGVTGFVGPDSTEPIPLTDEEVAAMNVAGDPQVRFGIEEGDQVRIVNTPVLEGLVGIVGQVDYEQQKVRVQVSMLGRETPRGTGILPGAAG